MTGFASPNTLAAIASLIGDTTRANMLCAGIFAGIVVVGKILGASLWGLFPLGACIASGVFLWIKDLIKHGRDVEWKSEQDRGEAATANLIPESVEVSDATMLLQTTSLLTPTVDQHGPWCRLGHDQPRDVRRRCRYVSQCTV